MVFFQLYILCCSIIETTGGQNECMRQISPTTVRQILFLKQWYLPFYSPLVLVVPPK